MTSSPQHGALRAAATRELLLPLGFVISFVLYYLLQQGLPMAIGAAAPCFLLYLWAPRWAHASVVAFDADAVRLLSQGQAPTLKGRYAKAIGMRLFAPPARVAERRAMVASETGQVRQAHAAYREALEEYGADAPLRVLLGYAHACFESGDDAEAVRVYGQLVETSAGLPGVEGNLARAMVRLGEELRRAITLLERVEMRVNAAEELAELRLVRALAHAKLGESGLARELAASIVPDSPGLAEWRTELNLALAAGAAPRG